MRDAWHEWRRALGLRPALPALRLLARGRDVALVYAVVVAGVAIALSVLPPDIAQGVVSSSSTNVVNLRQHPPYVLVVSAFVEPALGQLWILVPLVVAVAAVQRWLGRAATLVTLVLGHVGVTLFVATILTAGMVHGRITLAEATATDVGVSYGLVTAAGLLSARVSDRWRRLYVLGFSGGFVVALILARSFTDLGHLVAWLLGLALAVLVTAARRGDVPSPAPRGQAAAHDGVGGCAESLPAGPA